MRTILSVLLALLVIGLTAADPLVCPDGCADEPIGHAPGAPASAGQCGFCAGVRVTPPIAAAAPVVRPASPAIALLLDFSSPHLPGIDHPPRRA